MYARLIFLNNNELISHAAATDEALQVQFEVLRGAFYYYTVLYNAWTLSVHVYPVRDYIYNVLVFGFSTFKKILFTRTHVPMHIEPCQRLCALLYLTSSLRLCI